MSGDMNNKLEHSSHTDQRWSNDYLAYLTPSDVNYPDSSVSLDEFVLADDRDTANVFTLAPNQNAVQKTKSDDSMGSGKSKVQRKVSFNQVVEHSDSSCSILDNDSDNELPKGVENLGEIEEIAMLQSEPNEALPSERNQEEPSLSFRTALESLGSETADKLAETSPHGLYPEPSEEGEEEQEEPSEEQQEVNAEEEEQEFPEENLDYGQTGLDTRMLTCLPDKPPTGFQIFVNDFKIKYSERFSNLSVQEILDLCTEIWREMGAARKTEFQSSASRLQREYNEKVKLYHAQREKPRTAYQIFMSDFLARENEKRRKMKKASKLTKLELYQRGIRKWKRLKKSERAEFQEQSRLSQLYAKRKSTYSSVSEPIMSQRKL